MAVSTRMTSLSILPSHQNEQVAWTDFQMAARLLIESMQLKIASPVLYAGR